MTSTITPAILILGLPPAALCGIDLVSFTSSPRFKGIKDLPPGFHFVFTGATTSWSVRHGVWFRVDQVKDTQPPELFVRKWDPAREELVEEEDGAEQLRLKANLGSIWKEGLSPYRHSPPTTDIDTSTTATASSTAVASSNNEDVKEGDWTALTDCITQTLLGKVTGGEWNNWTMTSATSAAQDMDHIPGLSSEEGKPKEKELTFLPINLKQTWRSGAIGRERTEAAQDRSWALGDVIRNYCSWGEENEVVGEMQLTFLMVLTLSNHSCLEQWKRLLNLVFTCQTAAMDRPGLFVRILTVLKLQLQHCNDVGEGGLFDLADDGGSMLRQLLRNFRRGLDQVEGERTKTAARQEVRAKFEELEGYVRSEFGWDLGDSYVRRGMLELEDGEQVEMELEDLEGEDERGEYAPVVVDLQGRTVDEME